MSEHGVRLFEQPVEKDDVRGLARLVRESGLGVMVDESMTDRASLERLIAEKACTAVNVRISKCGGLMASLARCREVTGAGLTLQIGCQVGESSLLSAAQMALISAVEKVDYAEGCFGLHLLREDPAHPVLQFGRGGNPPNRPHGSGFGVEVDETVLKRWTVRHETITLNS
jgi:muconate cycloisomerase